MKYSQSILVKGGRRILLRNGEASDGGAVLELSVVADNARAMALYPTGLVCGIRPKPQRVLFPNGRLSGGRFHAAGTVEM